MAMAVALAVALAVAVAVAVAVAAGERGDASPVPSCEIFNRFPLTPSRGTC